MSNITSNGIKQSKQMKRLIVILFTILSINTVFSQVEAVEVETSIKQVSSTEYDVIFEFFIDEGWHLYSQHNPKGASEAMVIKATDEGQTDFEIIGKAKESETHTKYNEMFDKDEVFFEEEAKLVQRVKLKNKKLKELKLTITGQVCESSCLPYEQEFEIKIKHKKHKKHSKKKSKKSKTKNKHNKFKLDKNMLIIGGGILGVILFIIILIVALKKKKK